MKRDVDLLIIGSGPAGSSAALHLAQLDPDLARHTAVLERARHPRPKLCGGGIVSDCALILAKLGLDMYEVPTIDARSANLFFKGRGLRLRLNDRLAFHVARRTEFDGWLAKRVQDRGVAVHEDTQVQSVRQDGAGVVVETNRGTFRARAVIGADGSKGVVRRAVAGDHGRVARLLEVITPPPATASDEPLPAPEEALFEFRNVTDGIQGYFWSFPVRVDGDGLRSLGIFDARSVDAPSAGSLKGYLDRELTRQGIRMQDYKLEGHPIHMFSPKSVLSAPHMLLAGDAAGSDPLLGEGISFALGYGELAARAAVDAFRSGDFSFADYTRRVHRSRMGRALLLRHYSAQIIYRLRHPLLQRAVWSYLAPLARPFIVHKLFNWVTPGPALPAARVDPATNVLSAGNAG